MTARLILALIALAALPASSAQAGRVAFTSAQEGEASVQVVQSDGSGRGTLVPTPPIPPGLPA